jgi:hypothetical protein
MGLILSAHDLSARLGTVNRKRSARCGFAAHFQGTVVDRTFRKCPWAMWDVCGRHGNRGCEKVVSQINKPVLIDPVTTPPFDRIQRFQGQQFNPSSVDNLALRNRHIGTARGRRKADQARHKAPKHAAIQSCLSQAVAPINFDCARSNGERGILMAVVPVVLVAVRTEHHEALPVRPLVELVAGPFTHDRPHAASRAG